MVDAVTKPLSTYIYAQATRTDGGGWEALSRPAGLRRCRGQQAVRIKRIPGGSWLSTAVKWGFVTRRHMAPFVMKVFRGSHIKAAPS